MPLNQEEGIKDMREFINANTDKVDHEYARGLLQELINQLEDSFGINTNSIITDVYEARD